MEILWLIRYKDLRVGEYCCKRKKMSSSSIENPTLMRNFDYKFLITLLFWYEFYDPYDQSMMKILWLIRYKDLRVAEYCCERKKMSSSSIETPMLMRNFDYKFLITLLFWYEFYDLDLTQ